MDSQSPPGLLSATPTRIVVKGLERTTRILHLTDAHVCMPDVGSTYEAACREDRARRPAGEQETRFAKMLAAATSTDIDLLLLTGDIVHYPAHTSIQFAREYLDRAGKPWLFIGGNHDWYFPGQQPDTALRQEQLSLLAPLFGPLQPSLYHRHELNGLQFLTVDNSTYQINAEQLAFARETLNNGLPTVLLIHIPITQPQLRTPTIEKWGDPILMGDTIDESQRDLWAWEPDRAETQEFIEVLRTTPNLVTILCGHVHFAHEERFGDNATQFVGAPAFDSGFRLMEFVPG